MEKTSEEVGGGDGGQRTLIFTGKKRDWPGPRRKLWRIRRQLLQTHEAIWEGVGGQKIKKKRVL